MRRHVPPSYEEEMKWQELLARVAVISSITSMIFGFPVILYLFPDASFPTDLDPFTRFMSNLLFVSALAVLPSLVVAPVAIIGGAFSFLRASNLESSC